MFLRNDIEPNRENICVLAEMFVPRFIRDQAVLLVPAKFAYGGCCAHRSLLIISGDPICQSLFEFSCIP